MEFGMPAWRENWDATRRHSVDWWSRLGMVVSMIGALWPEGLEHEALVEPPEPESIREGYVNAELRVQRIHWDLARRAFPADMLPIAHTDLGPGSLALFLGSEPGFSSDTIWFEPCLQDVANPEELLLLVFDPANTWWQVTESILRACVRWAEGRYLVGCPDLVEPYR